MPNEIVDIRESCKTSEFFEKPPLSEAKKHHNLYGDIM
jgi:hypothetical protein